MHHVQRFSPQRPFGSGCGGAPKITPEQGLSEVIDWVNGNWDEIKDVPLVYQHRA